MTRTLADSTLERFRTRLLAEQERLQQLIDEHQQELENARLAEGAADRSPDPANAEAGSMAFEYEKELSIERNAADLLRKVELALRRIDAGAYGNCERCGDPIPVTRLEVLPYVTFCVTCARSD